MRHPFRNAFQHFPRCACCSRGAETTGSREAAPPFIAGEERGRPSRSPLGLAPRTGPSPAWGRGHRALRALRPGGRGRPGDSAFLPHCTHGEKRVPASAPPLTWALGAGRASLFPEGEKLPGSSSSHKFRASREPLGGAAAGFPGAQPRAVGTLPGSPSPCVAGGFEKCLENVGYVCGLQHFLCQSVFLTPSSTDFLKSPRT